MLSNSKSLFDRAQRVIPSGVNSPVRYYDPFPFFAVSGKGSTMRTADNETYIDYCMGYGALLLGHSYSTVTESVKSRIDDGSLFCVPTEEEIQLAELISKAVQCAEMIRLVNTGMEATMNAIRLARAFTKKKKVVKFDGCYHGAYDYVLPKPGVDASISDGIINEASSQTLVLPYNDSETLEQVVKEDDDVGCVIVEPVAANMGLVLPEKQYLNEIRRITRHNNIVLIFDEVVTGFRLALGGAGEFFGIKPDLATFAKAIGNGFPIAAITGKREIMQQLSPSGKVYQASTYAGNPACVSASIATIEVLCKAKNEIYPKIARTCDNIVSGIKDALKDFKLDCTINNIGSMFQLFFTDEKVKNAVSANKSDPIMFRKLFNELLKRGVFIPPSRLETCFISYSHSEDDADKTVESYYESLREVKQS
ncbi:MAG: aspartate aminotransferase family protein [Candidatus Nitrosopolaris wilkensis]|nr:MAG: aspartate aminotransferase family protein [Candidatus Nitrosopolaris wilkensis]